jgi:predicted Ser/Thr protein kinase
MICPRCSVGEISEATQECLVCGFSRTGGVLVEANDWSAHDDPVLPSLERQFQVEGVLRRGAASRIYLARDQVTGRLCSLKVLPLTDAAPGTIDRFKKDAQRAAALDHPHIVALSSFGATDGAVWYAMEYVQGRSLGDLLRTADRMDLKTCLRLVEQIASALEYGHRRGITHGNVKPSNVLVDPEGWARVADFGVNAAFGALPRRQPELSIEENFGHVAPERFGSAGEAGPAADQYSLAVLAFSCLARRPPFVGETMDAIARHHLEGPAPSLGETRPDLPPHVATTLARAMRRRPADRFAGVLDFVTALAGVPVAEPATIPVAEPAPIPVAEPAPVPVAQPAPVPETEPAPIPVAARPVPVEAITPPAPVPVPPPKVVEPEPAVAVAREIPKVEAAPHLPLLFVERSGAGRGPETDDDEDEVEPQVKAGPAMLARDEDAEDREDRAAAEAAREPVLLWPAAREPVSPAAAPESGTERRNALFADGEQPKSGADVARAAAKVQQFMSRWQSLPRTTRMGGGAAAAAAILLLAVVWWRVARGHEERGPDWVGGGPPAGFIDSAPRLTGTRPVTRPQTETTPTRPTPVTGPSTRPITVAQPDSARPRPPVTPTLSANDPAHLFINATPWGLLFIDDRPMGNTPRADLQIPPGMHRIRITRDGYLPYETEIAIEAGETLKLTDIVLQERPQ